MKAKAADPSQKIIHDGCALYEDDFCTFRSTFTNYQEREDFEKGWTEWRRVDEKLDV